MCCERVTQKTAKHRQLCEKSQYLAPLHRSWWLSQQSSLQEQSLLRTGKDICIHIQIEVKNNSCANQKNQKWQQHRMRFELKNHHPLGQAIGCTRLSEALCSSNLARFKTSMTPSIIKRWSIICLPRTRPSKNKLSKQWERRKKQN